MGGDGLEVESYDRKKAGALINSSTSFIKIFVLEGSPQGNLEYLDLSRAGGSAPVIWKRLSRKPILSIFFVFLKLLVHKRQNFVSYDLRFFKLKVVGT
jgi:hypothetical protein